MVILDPDIVRASVRPTECDPPLIVDPDAISQRRKAFQLLEPVTTGLPEFVQALDRVELAKFAAGSTLNIGRKPPTWFTAPNTFSFKIMERADHVSLNKA
jgi:hypothetical protein